MAEAPEVYMEDERCKSVCWMAEYGRDAMCTLPEGHEGPHEDCEEGWEW